MYFKKGVPKFIWTVNLSKIPVPFNLAVIHCAYKDLLFVSDEVLCVTCGLHIVL